MREVGKSLGVPIHVFGPETHMTAIVGMALGIFSFSCHPLRILLEYQIFFENRKTTDRCT